MIGPFAHGIHDRCNQLKSVISTGFAHDGPAVTDVSTDGQELVVRLYVHMRSKILAESSETEQVECRCVEFLRDSVRPLGATDSVLTVALNQMTSSATKWP
jgi:hypothetical protein